MDPARTVAEILHRQAGRRGSLLPILHDVQEALGCVPFDVVPAIAKALNLSRAEVHGTITFYHDFRGEPPTKVVIKLCRAEACQARGVAQVASIIESDARIQVETVYCLGLCANGPAAMVGQQVFAGLDAENTRGLIDRVAIS